MEVTMALKNLLNGNKLPILFIGSGFSRRYLNSPDWEGLLIKVYEYIGKTTRDFKTLKQRIKNASDNRNLTDGNLNALVASAIEEEFNNAFYKNETLLELYGHWIDEEVNPFRKTIATILSNLEPVKEKRAELEQFKTLRDKSIATITTNYDQLLEQVLKFPSESVFIGQSQLFNPQSLELGELYKIHGCISNPDEIIITDKDYEHFKDNARLFSAKLLTLISENPVIFIGYSLNDPNMHQILTDLVGCLTDDQIRKLNNHFYLVDYEKGQQELIEKEFMFVAHSYHNAKTSFPISVISTDNYLKVYKELSTLTPSMHINTVKQVKRIVKEIVVESTEANEEKDEVITILLEDISKLDESHQKFAIAIGNAKEMTSNLFGYQTRPVQSIFEDILFDNQNFNHKQLITGTYENVYLKTKRKLPLYKYIYCMSEADLINFPNVYTHYKEHQIINDYLNNQLRATLEKIPKITSVDQIPEAITLYRTYAFILKNIKNLPLKEVEAFLKNEFSKYSTFDRNEKSHLHRLIAVYDLVKYKK